MTSTSARTTLAAQITSTMHPASNRSLDNHRLVRQFVFIVLISGEMLLQQLRDALHSMQHTRLEATVSELLLHLVADPDPAFDRYVPIEPAVGHDLNIVVGHQQIDQHS